MANYLRIKNLSTNVVDFDCDVGVDGTTKRSEITGRVFPSKVNDSGGNYVIGINIDSLACSFEYK